MATHKPGRYLLLYGSQTGQSKAIAEEIFERSSKHDLDPELHCMSEMVKEFQVETERCVVVVTSSTGDGDPPDTAIKFVRRLNRKTLPPDYLATVSYTVLGLGDSNYSNFCRNPKNIDKRFSELGAERFHPSVFADEVEGLEVTADPWIDTLFPALQKLVGVSTDTSTQNTEDSGVVTTQCNGKLPADSPEQKSINTKSPTDSVSVAQRSENNSERTSVPVIMNGTASVSKEENKTDTAPSNTDLPNTELLSSQKGHLDNDHISSNIEQEKILSQVAEREQILDNSSSETTGMKNSADCNEVQQNEIEDALVLNTPVSGVPSLGVSSAALLEKALTLPAATPAFLTASFLPPDENLRCKMGEMGWQNDCKPPSAASDIIRARVVSAHRLTAEDAVKKTLLLKLCFKGSSLRYRPGDSISVICANDDKEVSQLIKRLGLVSQADLPLRLSIMPDTKKRRAAVPPHIPEEGASLRYILKNCIDIRQPPKKALLRHLVDSTSDPCEKRRLQELCSKEGAEDYTAFVHGEHVSLLDVLYTFPSCRPAVERLIEHLPRLQPRPYSICSCEQWQPGHLDIAFNVVTIPTSQNRLYSRRGLCTGWLDDITTPIQRHAGKESAAPDQLAELDRQMESVSLTDIEIQIFARTNQHFRTPDNLSVPLIMIGPGTGIAPYIGFLQERQLRMQKEGDNSSIGETWLLFGCRHKEKDVLFQPAIQEFQQRKVLTKFLPAFSRDPQDDDERAPRYVQDNIRAHASEICSLIRDKEVVVFVCGDAKHMAADVTEAFVAVLMQELGLTLDKAKEYVMSMRIHHRYLEDVWT